MIAVDTGPTASAMRPYCDPSAHPPAIRIAFHAKEPIAVSAVNLTGAISVKAPLAAPERLGVDAQEPSVAQDQRAPAAASDLVQDQRPDHRAGSRGAESAEEVQHALLHLIAGERQDDLRGNRREYTLHHDQREQTGIPAGAHEVLNPGCNGHVGKSDAQRRRAVRSRSADPVRPSCGKLARTPPHRLRLVPVCAEKPRGRRSPTRTARAASLKPVPV